MKHSTGPPTKEERRRFEAIKQVGCVPCWLVGIGFQPCAVHHVVEGRKRLGHRFTYGNCDWHHQGYPFNGVDERASESLAGPSLAKNPRAFHEQFGTEHELVAMCDELIAPLLSRSGATPKGNP